MELTFDDPTSISAIKDVDKLPITTPSAKPRNTHIFIAMLLCLEFLSLTTFFCSVISVQPQPVCNSTAYGRPIRSDCYNAYHLIPEPTDPSGSIVRHIFVEPQLLSPPFTFVRDYLGSGMVQLPKLWVYGKLALYR